MTLSRFFLLCFLTIFSFSVSAQPLSKSSPPHGLSTHASFQQLPLGQSMRLDGTYHLLVEDHAEHAFERHYIQTPQGRVELQDRKALRSISPGSGVSLRGIKRSHQTLEVSHIEALYEPAAGGPGETGEPPPALPNGLGAQNTQVYLIRFQDDPTAPDYNTVQSLFGTVDTFMRTSSFNQTWLTGRVIPTVITVPYNRSACTDGMLLADSANQTANALGYSTSSFDRHVYVFPKSGCTWTGLAMVNEKPSRAWINGSYTLKAMAHEMGHTFGLRHAHAQDCDVSPLGNTCTRLPYGDAANVMGNVRTGDFSGYDKERLGWLREGSHPSFLTASYGATFTLDSYSTNTLTPKVLRIPRGVDANGNQLYFYVEKRTANGNDSVLNGVGNLTQGLMVRTVTHGDGDSIHQIDMTPNSAVGSTADLADGALPLGASFTDPLTGVSFQFSSTTAQGGAQVIVTYPGPFCTPYAPTVNLRTSSVTALPGAQFSLPFTITNNNSSACGVTGFGHNRTVSSWFAVNTTDPSYMNLSPNARQDGVWNVTLDSNTPAGTYPLQMEWSDRPGEPEVVGYGYATLFVVQTCPAGTTPNAQQVCVAQEGGTGGWGGGEQPYQEALEEYFALAYGWMELYPLG